ncbi:HIT family protein [Pseudoduganella chitinolytica]|uniref:HIT family protein n=1 Tax=Pseudoduganella chitinolytica TaxID=34070 RepID=A0ABY8B9I6_9BURK|nr:HIT family protein [Pseudoduganella chitinolytica]WEF32597.1 HIT family protein [Pseudoduganella chitinolytica]
MTCDLCTLLAAPPVGAVIWEDAQLAVVAVDEPGYPGFTRVVWKAHVKEMTDLAPAERAHVMAAVWAVETAQRAVLAPHKVNLASFGNMTPHVHWHVIPRYTDDAHFPNPTWGARQRDAAPGALQARAALLPRLHAAIVDQLNELHHA